MNKEEIYKKALEKWGLEPQLNMVIEECAELIQSIQKLRRLPAPEREKQIIGNLAEETADVLIMLEQLNLMFEKDNFKDAVESKKIQKIKRLEEKVLKELKSGK